MQPTTTLLGEYQQLLPGLLSLSEFISAVGNAMTKASSLTKTRKKKIHLCEFWRFQGSFLTGLHTQSAD
jgi:hypothetical protein